MTEQKARHKQTGEVITVTQFTGEEHPYVAHGDNLNYIVNLKYNNNFYLDPGDYIDITDHTNRKVLLKSNFDYNYEVIE